jgi:hypothetical protein
MTNFMIIIFLDSCVGASKQHYNIPIFLFTTDGIILKEILLLQLMLLLVFE